MVDILEANTEIAKYILNVLKKLGKIEALYDRTQFVDTRELLQAYLTNVPKQYRDYNREMAESAFSGRLDIVEQMIQLGASDFDEAMGEAAKGGHRDIVERMIQLGARHFDRAMAEATSRGHHDIVEWMIQLGANNFDRALREAAIGGHRDIVEWMIQLGASSFDWAWLVRMSKDIVISSSF